MAFFNVFYVYLIQKKSKIIVNKYNFKPGKKMVKYRCTNRDMFFKKGGFKVFAIGDRVLYPMYGAGIIEAIEDKLVDGIKTAYYVMKISVGNLKISISVNKAEEKGIRNIAAPAEVMDIINKADTIEMPDNWNVRYKENTERLKTGDLRTEVQVYKTLIMRERGKMLSSIEKKMLTNAKQMIVSEIILSHNVDKPTAERMLLDSVMQPA